MTDPIPAATLIVMRERDGRPPELLMVERAAGMAFAGGALVFPGGRIDPADHAQAVTLEDDIQDAPARIAAVRETIEETGIAIGVPGLDPAAARSLRGGCGFGEVLAAMGLSLDLNALFPFARWCPQLPQPRTFDTLFYLARLPADAIEPEADGIETVKAMWVEAQAVLDAAAAGDARLIFPTRRNLDRLALFASFEDAAADARAHPIETITPWIERRDGVDHLCIPEGLGYPITSEPLADAERY